MAVDPSPASPHMPRFPHPAHVLTDLARAGDWQRFAALLDENLRAIEDHEAQAGNNEQTFSMGGLLAVATSPRWYPSRDITLTEIVGSLNSNGSTTTTVNVRRNGTTIATLTFASGVNVTSTTTISTPALTADTDYLTVEVAAAGTSSADLDVQVRFE